jgi:hypothetical protein
MFAAHTHSGVGAEKPNDRHRLLRTKSQAKKKAYYPARFLSARARADEFSISELLISSSITPSNPASTSWRIASERLGILF